MLEQLNTPEMREIGEVLETCDLQRMRFEHDRDIIFDCACKIIRENGLQELFFNEVAKEVAKSREE